MPNKIILSKEDPEIADALSDCKVGQPKKLELTVVPTRDDDRIFEADVTEVAYGPGDTETSEDYPEPEAKPLPQNKAGSAKGLPATY